MPKQIPPSKFIDTKGRLTPELIAFLHEHLGYSIKTLEKTVYRQIRFHKNAITLYKNVFFDAKCFTKSEEQWLLLIVHEQFHREEIGNNIFRAMGWYLGYLWGFARSGFSYMKNPYEVRAYMAEREFGGRIR